MEDAALKLMKGRKYLWKWKENYSGSYEDMIFDLISKADSGRIDRLRLAFPDYVAAFEEYSSHSQPDIFLEKCREAN